MMSRNVRGFMSLFHSEKPVVCKVHGFCVAGGTDMALCSDLLVDRGRREDRLPAGAGLGRADDGAVGAPDRARAGQAAAAHRRLVSGTEAVEWGLATEAAPAGRARRALRGRCSSGSRGVPVNQLVMHKLLVNQAVDAQGLARDAGARHLLRRHRPPHRRRASRFQQRAAEAGFKQAVRERDEPFGDFGAPRSRRRR